MVRVTVFHSEKTGKARFAELLYGVVYKGKTSPEVGRRFKGSLVAAVLLKPFNSEPL